MSIKAKNGPVDRAAEIAVVEVMLRQIAQLPAPAGLEDRLQMRLRAALRQQPRRREWFAFLRQDGAWLHASGLRAVAAVAIAAVVMGGGWGVASRIQPAAQQGSVQPVPLSTPGFSSAGAIRTPQTLNGPVVETAVRSTARPDRTVKAKQRRKSVTKPEAEREK
jgi:negative regulator of sigma E activity